MELIDAYKKIKDQKFNLFLTNDVAGLLKISNEHAGQILSRLVKKGLLIRLIRGRFSFSRDIDPNLIPPILTYPLDSYISLQSALYFHGMISQVPQVIYAVSLDRTKRIKTPLATFSIHHLSPNFFFGFEPTGKNQVLMATPEKALLDFFYCNPGKTGLFKRLPELEFPKDFDFEKAWNYIDKIHSSNRRSLVRRLMAEAVC